LTNYFFALISRIINSRKSLIFFNYIYIYKTQAQKSSYPKFEHVWTMAQESAKLSFQSFQFFKHFIYKKIEKCIEKTNYPIPQFQCQFSPFYPFFHFRLQHVWNQILYNVLKNISDINSWFPCRINKNLNLEELL